MLAASVEQRESLSLAAPSGPLVVGLTVAPPNQGWVDLTLNLTGAEPGDGVRDAAVEATGPDGEAVAVDLERCGRDCLTGTATLDQRGDWPFVATFDSNRGDHRVALVAPLPAGDGRPLLRDAVAAMEDLDSAAVTERLREEIGGTQPWSDCKFAVPDAMRWIVRGGSGKVAIDDRGPAALRTRRPLEGVRLTGTGLRVAGRLLRPVLPRRRSREDSPTPTWSTSTPSPSSTS